MNEFKVGLLAIFTIASLVAMSLKITSNQSGFGQYVTYRTIVKDASGIFPKTPIKVAGISAGRIASIELQGNTALITFEILKQIDVTKNSKLRIKSVGFLGDKYIEIFIGDSNQLLQKFDFIPSEEAAGIENLVKDTSEVLADVKKIVRTLKDTIAPDNGETPMKDILADISELVKNSKEAAKTMKNIMGNNEEKISQLMDNLNEFSSELALQMDRGNKESAISDVKQIMANVNKMTADMQAIVADLKKGKGTLGKMLVEDEIADQVKETLSSVQKIVGKAENIRTELSVFSGMNTRSGADTEFALRLFPSPERFYHLGVSTSEFGPDREKLTDITTNGVKVSETRLERDKNTFRFNAQIGRRMQDIAFRGGIIESTGGLGIDYHLHKLGTKFSAEVYDYKTKIGANLRLSSEIQLWNVLYGKASISDTLRKARTTTVSAGLRFNDEDLKSLLGFVL